MVKRIRRYEEERIYASPTAVPTREALVAGEVVGSSSRCVMDDFLEANSDISVETWSWYDLGHRWYCARRYDDKERA